MKLQRDRHQRPLVPVKASKVSMNQSKGSASRRIDDLRGRVDAGGVSETVTGADSEPASRRNRGSFLLKGHRSSPDQRGYEVAQ